MQLHDRACEPQAQCEAAVVALARARLRGQHGLEFGGRMFRRGNIYVDAHRTFVFAFSSDPHLASLVAANAIRDQRSEGPQDPHSVHE